MKNDEFLTVYKQALLEHGFTEYLAEFFVSQLNDVLFRIDTLNKSVPEISFELVSNRI